MEWGWGREVLSHAHILRTTEKFSVVVRCVVESGLEGRGLSMAL